MQILIDGVLKNTKGCYVLNDQNLNESYHSILQHPVKTQNVKAATSGHVYVLNYEPNSFVRKYPMTYNQFLENGSKFEADHVITIEYGSEWKLTQPLRFIVNSHSQRPTGDPILFLKNKVLVFESVANDGTVWFQDPEYFRVKIECGCITNLIKQKQIELVKPGKSLYCFFNTETNKIVNP